MSLIGESVFSRRPGVFVAQVPTIAHAAATATEGIGVWVAPQNCRLRGWHFYPLAAVSGANTNTTHLNLFDDSTEIDNYDLTSGNDLAVTGYTGATDLTRDLTKGDRITLKAEKVGTGLDVPAGTLVIEYDYQG